MSCPEITDSTFVPPPALIGGAAPPGDIVINFGAAEPAGRSASRTIDAGVARLAARSVDAGAAVYNEVLRLARKRRFQVAFGLFQIGLVTFDIVTDWIVMMELFRSGASGWGALCAIFLVGSYLLVYVSVLLYLRKSRKQRKHQGSRFNLLRWGVVGFPCGVLFLDVCMLLEPFNLVWYLNEDLQTFMPSYRATRTIIECVFEALPQSILQLILATRGARGVPTYLLVQSLTVSILHLVSILFFTAMAAHYANVPIWAHVKVQAQMGLGIPLVGLKRHRIKQWRYEGPILKESQVVVHAASICLMHDASRARMLAPLSLYYSYYTGNTLLPTAPFSSLPVPPRVHQSVTRASLTSSALAHPHASRTRMHRAPACIATGW